MKIRNSILSRICCAAFAAVMVTFVQPRMAAQPAGGATVTGQVSNAATRSFLEGALITLSGTNRSTTTDREGHFEIGGVPAGEVTLVVSYAGLDTQRVVVAAPQSGVVVHNV